MIIPNLYLISNFKDKYIIKTIISKTPMYWTTNHLIYKPTTFIYKDKNTVVFTPDIKGGVIGNIDGENIQCQEVFDLFSCYDFGYTTEELIYWLNNLDEYFKKLQEKIDMDIIWRNEHN